MNQVCQGTPADEDIARLEALLAGDRDAQRFYLAYMRLDADLSLGADVPNERQRSLSAIGDQPSAGEKDEGGRMNDEEHDSTVHPSSFIPHPSSRNRRNLTFGIVAGFAFLAGFIGWAAVTYLPGIVKDHDKPGTETDNRVIARLMNAHDVEWTDGGVPESTWYKAGQRLAFESGLVAIRYATGAEVVIEGPAEFVVGGTEAAGGEEEGNRHQGTKAQKKDREKSVHPSSFNLHPSNSGYLSLGRLVARCDTDESKGFAIHTPTTHVVDLGTEFAVHVRESGETETHVIEGLVRLYAGNTSEVLAADATALVKDSTIARIERPTARFKRRMPGIDWDADAVVLATEAFGYSDDTLTQQSGGQGWRPGSVWNVSHQPRGNPVASVARGQLQLDDASASRALATPVDERTGGRRTRVSFDLAIRVSPGSQSGGAFEAVELLNGGERAIVLGLVRRISGVESDRVALFVEQGATDLGIDLGPWVDSLHHYDIDIDWTNLAIAVQRDGRQIGSQSLRIAPVFDEVRLVSSNKNPQTQPNVVDNFRIRSMPAEGTASPEVESRSP
ncbi:MAG: hypothetical protein MI757_03750 [Pirellulales bacterium]|nr:hypothetical protein [Pirellulales bacterium]